MAVGLLGFVYGWVFNLPSSTVVYAGIIFLVPGSLAVTILHQGQSLLEVSTFGFSFLDVAIAIAVGLLIVSIPQHHLRQPSQASGGYVGVTALI